MTLGFRLFTETVKLYLARQRNQEGSRIRSKLVFGALALSLLPVVFLFLFSYAVLNRNLDKWFSAPVEGMNIQLRDAAVGLGEEVQSRADALAHWLAAVPEVRNGTADFARLCRENRIAELRIDTPGGNRVLCTSSASVPLFISRVSLRDGLGGEETLVVRVRPHVDVVEKQNQIQAYVNKYNQLAPDRRSFRYLYLMFQALIALFILFVATWIALLLARQISVPISALLDAAGEVRKGNLAIASNVTAIDETGDAGSRLQRNDARLEANSRELESRRRFTEAILESIPTGVISLSSDGRIQRVNRALHGLFPEDQIERAARLEDLFPADDVAEIRYLMKRARRTGWLRSQIDLRIARRRFCIWR